MAWKIKVDSVAVPRCLLEYEDEGGNKKYQHVSKVYTKGQIVPDRNVSPLIQKLYEDGDEHTLSVYEKVSNDEEENLPPFNGYSDLDENEVRAYMYNKSSDEIEKIKKYERDHQNRSGIVDYVIGYGEAPQDRKENNVIGQSGSQKAAGVDSAKKLITPKSGKKAEKVVANEPVKESVKKTEEPAPKAKAQKRSSVKKPANSEE